MSLVKKIFQISAFIFLTYFLFSCKEGCVEADQFDTYYVTADSNPIIDGIYGTYDSIDGGQRAQWHSTGLKSNGDDFLIYVTGGWTAWNGTGIGARQFSSLPSCNVCAKNKNKRSTNCLCAPGQNSVPDLTALNIPSTADCSVTANQNDPFKCTCTKDYANQGRYGDPDTYFIELNSREKDGTPKIADRQDPCKFEKGMGLYLGLFGNNGAVMPARIYHLYSIEAGCNIARDSNQRCIDSAGIDRTFYVYRSPNKRIFMKDDNDGNGDRGVDTNTSNDSYHNPNEEVKLLISDQYYSDNFGSFNVSFIRGVGKKNDDGLLEYIVRTVEDVMLGPVNDDGQRQGGVIRFMYKAVVQDSGFSTMVQILLALYISIYGLATLFGLAEISKKELLTRILKIGLVLTFTSPQSWGMYNDIVVAFFKDSMDYVVSMMMTLNDSLLDSSSAIITMQADRVKDYSNATRFAYVDGTIKNMMSDETARKVFGLFFGTWFGFIYIPIIYAMIGFFIYVMLFIAMVYLTNLLKIIFVLSLGPIFICFTLFSHTNQMFKNWLAFLGARSLEIILVFAVLYNFLFLINREFLSLLSFRTCAEGFDIIPHYLPIRVLVSYVSNHSPFYWFSKFLVITGFIFITKLIVIKIADLAGHLIEIGGVANKDGASDVGHGVGGFSMAAGMASEIGGALKLGAKKVGGFAGRQAINGATAAARKSGLAAKWNALGKKLPFSGPKTMYRNRMIASAIKAAKASGAAKGYTGASLDAHVREVARSELQKYAYHNPTKAAAMGLNAHAIGDRLEKVLTKDALSEFLRQKAKEIKTQTDPSSIPVGKEFRAQLRKDAIAWADKNLSGGSSAVTSLFGEKGQRGGDIHNSKFVNKGDKKIRGLIRGLSDIDPADAAKMFAEDYKKQAEYLDSLSDKEYRKEKLKQRAGASYLGAAANAIERGGKALTRSTKFNTDLARKSFERGLQNQEDRGDGILDRMGINTAKGFSITKRIKMLDRALNKEGEDSYKTNAEQEKIKQLRDRQQNDSLSKDKRKFAESQLDKAMIKEVDKTLEDHKKANKKILSKKLSRAKEERLLALEKEATEKKLNDILNAKEASDRERIAALSRVCDRAAFSEVVETVRDIRYGINSQGKLRAEEILKGLEDQSLTVDQAKQQLKELSEQSVIPRSFTVEFGADIGKIGIQVANVGLVESSIMIGYNPNTKDTALSQREIQETLEKEAKKHDLEVKGRIAKLDKRIKEVEAEVLDQRIKAVTDADPNDKRQLAKLKSEINELDIKVNKFEQELKSV